MNKGSKIYIAGHRGLVGSAIVRALQDKGYSNLVYRTSTELDLRRQADVESFFEMERPEYIYLAAAKVGGILANSTYKAEFIYDNLIIASNVIQAAYQYGAKKLLNLGSSCIYPRSAPQPMKEEHLLTGSLEPTNEPYAIAKIAAIKLCRYYNEQYGTNFISGMPTNLYGPGDNFDLEASHVLPALIRKMHLGRCLENSDFESIREDFRKYPIRTQNVSKLKETEIIDLLSSLGIKKETVEIWGSGTPYREFLYIDDLSDACVFLMENYDYKDIGEFINIGAGEDLRIRDLAELIREIVGYDGEITCDSSKPDGMPKKLLDVSRIKAKGWGPKKSLKGGIKDSYEWYLKQETLKWAG
ncbi:MAG TPA: GDP-L-fucose synthase [Nitrospirota bacterium]|nr:GDP-L-fucose synthase [Nitrospirota bacterium]